MSKDAWGLFMQDFDEVKDRMKRFEEKLARSEFDRATCRDIYQAIYSLSERYEKKKDQFTHAQSNALRTLFEEDVLFQGGLFNIRTIAAHIIKNSGVEDGMFEMRTQAREPISISATSSAGHVFEGNQVELDAVQYGEPAVFRIDHCQWLKAAISQIAKAIESVEN